MADGGNQTMVEVGAGVSVAGRGVEVARKASMAEQDVKNIVIARRAIARRHVRRSAMSNLVGALGDCFAVKNKNTARNDIKTGVL